MLEWILVVFISILSITIIFPFAFSLTDYSWMINGDMTQVIVSWANFVRTPWEQPLTLISNLAPGSNSTMLQTDSLPWMSLFFKFITHTFNFSYNWHYFGIWLISCWILQGLFAKLIADELQLKLETKLLLIVYLLFSPILIYRFGHTSLMAEWLILAVIFDTIKTLHQTIRISKRETKRNSSLSSTPTFLRALFFPIFAIGIHPYLFALITPWYLVIMLLAKNSIYKKISYYLLLSLGLFSAYKILGFTAVKGPSGGDFGACNTDLLFLFNSFGLSRFLPALRYFWCQPEGFAYMGVSGLFLFFTFFKQLKELVRNLFKSNYGKVFITLLALSLIYALASPIRFGGNAIIYLPFYNWIEPIPSIFRASGRWMFLVFYFMSISLIYLLDRSHLKNKRLIISALLIIHLFEFSKNYRLFYPIEMKYSLADVNAVAEKIPETSKNQIMKLAPSMVAVFCGMDKKQWEFDEWGVVMMALAQKGWKVDSVLGARIDQDAIQECHKRNKLYESDTVDYLSLAPLILKSKSKPTNPNFKELIPNIYFIDHN